MARKSTRQALVLLCLIAMLAVGTVGIGTAAAATNGTIKNEGPCDKKLSEVKVGSIIPGSNPTLDLEDQADALITSAKIFNKKYNGVGGHCIAVDWCDPKVDPNAAADCARRSPTATQWRRSTTRHRTEATPLSRSSRTRASPAST